MTVETGHTVGSLIKMQELHQVTVAHACNFSYSGDRDQEYQGLKPGPDR
jgi:hypothetical protein